MKAIATGLAFSFLIALTGNVNAQLWYSQVSGLYTDLFGVHVLDSNNVYVVGEKGILLKTSDGGINWTIDTASSVDLYDVYYSSLQEAVLIGQYGSHHSTLNAGSSWVQQKLSNDAFIRFSENSKDTVFLITNLGKIYKSINAGAGINVDYSPLILTYMNDISMSGTGKPGIAVGDNGTVYRSQNGGGNWTESIVVKDDLNGAANDGKGTFIAVGDVGRVIRSTDWGLTWDTTIWTGSSLTALNSVAYAGNNIWWACGVDGLATKSTDGGLNWNAIKLGWAEALVHIDFKDGHGWIVGEFGKIYHYRDPLASVSSIEQNQLIRIGPNPVKDVLQINFTTKANNAELEIISVSGQHIMNKRIENTSSLISLDVSHLSKGIYFVLIQTDDGRLAEKFIVE